ncbi:hypothetical protein F2Q69_00034689 [Brassica cretica]|uniref:Uncharacterized protein n=1 Tax=Brassica cretica TaxID=69181 RepID=A0A8S9SJX1_BRACR|nr:hypothetical protein F2Q69_00034689 [Brassica cretica]
MVSPIRLGSIFSSALFLDSHRCSPAVLGLRHLGIVYYVTLVVFLPTVSFRFVYGVVVRLCPGFGSLVICLWDLPVPFGATVLPFSYVSLRMRSLSFIGIRRFSGFALLIISFVAMVRIGGLISWSQISKN